MITITPYRSTVREGRDGFGQLLHAEWTKFRTVRGWVIGMIAMPPSHTSSIVARLPRCA